MQILNPCKLKYLISLFLLVPFTCQAAENFEVWPKPQSLIYATGALPLPRYLEISVSNSISSLDQPANNALASLKSELDKRFKIGANIVFNSSSGFIKVIIDPAFVPSGCPRNSGSVTGFALLEEQGYKLLVSDNYIEIRAKHFVGLRNGINTLRVVLSQIVKPEIKKLEIQDWPTFQVRVLQLMGPFPQEETYIKQLVEFAELLKFNRIWVRVDDKVIYPDLANLGVDSAYKTNQLKNLVAFMKNHGFDVVPELALFGHASYIFSKTGYSDIQEGTSGENYCPRNPHTQQVARELIDTLIEVFEPTAFNMCADELSNGQMAVDSYCRNTAKKDLFSEHINWLYSYIASKGIQNVYMYADSLLLENQDGTGGAPHNTYLARPAINRNIKMLLWEYSEMASYPGMDILLNDGFYVGAVTWYRPTGISALAKYAYAKGLQEFVVSTWKQPIWMALDTEYQHGIELGGSFAWNPGMGLNEWTKPDGEFYRQMLNREFVHETEMLVDDFDSYPTGSLDTQNGWVIANRSEEESGHDFLVHPLFDRGNGTAGLSFFRFRGSVQNGWAYRLLKDKFDYQQIIECSLWLKSYTSGTSNVVFDFMNSATDLPWSGTEFMKFGVNSVNNNYKFYYQDGSNAWVPSSVPFETGKWYRLRIVYDLTTYKYDFYAMQNGQTEVAVAKGVPVSTMAIPRFFFIWYGQLSSDKVLIDDIQIKARMKNEVYSLGYDNLSTGTLHGQDGWEIGNPAEVSSQHDFQVQPGETSGNVLSFERATGPEMNVWAYKTLSLPSQPIQYIETSLSFKSKTIGNYNFYFYATDDAVNKWSGNILYEVGAEYTGLGYRFRYMKNGQRIISRVPCLQNTWYRMRVVQNLLNNTYSFFVKPEQENELVVITDVPVNFTGKPANIMLWGGNWNDDKFFIDDITVNVGTIHTCTEFLSGGFGYESDLNFDCVVDFNDLKIMVQDWLKCNDSSGCQYDATLYGDVDGNGIGSFVDYSFWARHFNECESHPDFCIK